MERKKTLEKPQTSSPVPPQTSSPFPPQASSLVPPEASFPPRQFSRLTCAGDHPRTLSSSYPSHVRPVLTLPHLPAREAEPQPLLGGGANSQGGSSEITDMVKIALSYPRGWCGCHCIPHHSQEDYQKPASPWSYIMVMVTISRIFVMAMALCVSCAPVSQPFVYPVHPSPVWAHTPGAVGSSAHCRANGGLAQGHVRSPAGPYESDSITIRPQLPPCGYLCCIGVLYR